MQSLSTTISHFSHPHPLHLTGTADMGHSGLPPCPACKTPVSGHAYRCSRGCSFFIHSWCATLPMAITHPGHSHHHLTLLAAPAHSHGSFTCDGCGRSGDGFSYRCTAPECDFDLHAVCAARPLEASHPSHGHPLHLSFCPPYKNRQFLCNLCCTAGSDHWLYRCGSCNFDAHLGCVGSGHGSGHGSHHHLNYSQSLPSNNNYVILLPQVNGLGRVNSYQPAPTAPFWGGLMMAGAEGAVQGVAQQGAQEVVQDMAGDGGGAAGDFISGVFDFFLN